MSLLEELRAKRDEIYAIAARSGLSEVKVFGSVVRGEESAQSDIDFLVDLSAGADPLGFVDFQEEVSAITRRKVDIVFRNGMHPLLKDRILQEAQPL